MEIDGSPAANAAAAVSVPRIQMEEMVRINFLDKSVVVNTYFSKTPIIGEVVETTDNSITIAPTLSNSGTDYHKSNFDKENTYYFPSNAIISLKEFE